ncbi:stress responsive alpha/beta barrel protein [Chitinophaga skermanii]|uniref:Stress responsive alpha/beta barrel protein n=1 Tax=Chitinophaga skermanii TaxID=331697 RepID=A0A327Q2S3_9BACT|nr:Dabb family protein [Chitinophaga skermanii]RAI98718.1 stress responsive alpha/beta barrel protein [Chitinophaga skermanii]
MSKKFVHVVNFYLKKGLSPEEIKDFEAGVSSLATIDEIKVFNLGTPADTDRPVIDKSYSYCLLTVFENQEAHDRYQVHPTHLAFVERCSRHWDKVVIFDSVSI